MDERSTPWICIWLTLLTDGPTMFTRDITSSWDGCTLGSQTIKIEYEPFLCPIYLSLLMMLYQDRALGYHRHTKTPPSTYLLSQGSFFRDYGMNGSKYIEMMSLISLWDALKDEDIEEDLPKDFVEDMKDDPKILRKNPKRIHLRVLLRIISRFGVYCLLDLVASIISRGIGLECRRSNNNQFNNVL